MKKVSAVILMLTLLLFSTVAMAEGVAVAETRLTIDLTDIILGVITILAGLVTTYVVPWVKQTRNEKWARIACYAAEQLFNNGEISDKLAYAEDFLKSKGIKVDTRVLIESVVGEFNMIKETLDESNEGIDIDDLSDDELRDAIAQMGISIEEIESCKTREDLEDLLLSTQD